MNYKDLIKSDTANKLKINNIPNQTIINNLNLLINKIILPVSKHFNKPISVSSGYRCLKLNSAVGGTADSQHVKGMAVDFTITGVSLELIVDFIRHNLIFDQLILEKTPKHAWIHASLNAAKNRKQVLFFDGKTYKNY
jgi:hypothetical protein